MTASERVYRCTPTVTPSGSLCMHEWRIIGCAPSIPLVLLHGFTGGGLQWERAAALLREPSRVLAPDLPGHGESHPRAGVSGCTFDAAALAIDSALDALGVEACDLHGYSMGGRLALYFALTRPARVRRLSLESASAGLADEDARKDRVRADEELARLACEEGIERFVERWEHTPVLASQQDLSPEDRERLRDLRLRNSVGGLASSLRGMGTGAQPYLGSRLVELSMPVLVMAGETDDKFSNIARDLARSIPDSRLALIAGAGHTPHLERPRPWAAALDSFIAEPQRGESCRSSGRL